MSEHNRVLKGKRGRTATNEAGRNTMVKYAICFIYRRTLADVETNKVEVNEQLKSH